MIKHKYAIGNKLTRDIKGRTIIATISDVNYEEALLSFEDGTSAWFSWHWICRDFKKVNVQ